MGTRAIEVNKYSLSDLAWISRCLFPSDFARELIEMGVDNATAVYLASAAKGKNVLALWQEFISDEETCALIERYIDWWLEKHK